MFNHLLYTCVLTLGLFFAACENVVEPKWENPKDPKGEDWNPPTVSVMDDAGVSINDKVTISASGKVGEGSKRKIEKYYWALDGKNFKDSSDSPSIKHTFTKAGDYTILVKVRDSEDVFSEMAEIVLTVEKNPPTVKAMDDAGVSINDKVKLSAVGNDPNGSVERYYWALDGEEYLDSNKTGSIETVFKKKGIYIVRVKVRDDDGIFSLPDSIVLNVVENAPTVEGMKDTQISIFDSVIVTAKGEDKNGKIEKYYWALDGKNFRDSTTKRSIKTAYSDSGVYTIRVKVRDDDDAFSVEDQIQVTVERNAPEVEMTPGGGVALRDEITINAEGSDVNGKVEMYYWALDGKTFRDSTIKNSIKKKFTKAGQSKVLVKVRDDDDLFSPTATATFTVSLSPPSVTAMQDTTVPINDKVRLYASGKDENGEVEKYYWALDGKTFADSTTDSSIVTKFTKASTYKVWVKARDNDGGFSPAAVFNVKVLTYPPSTVYHLYFRII